MEQGTLALEEGTKAADVPSGAGASLRVAMVPRSDWLCVHVCPFLSHLEFRVNL